MENLEGVKSAMDQIQQTELRYLLHYMLNVIVDQEHQIEMLESRLISVEEGLEHTNYCMRRE